MDYKRDCEEHSSSVIPVSASLIQQFFRPHHNGQSLSDKGGWNMYRYSKLLELQGSKKKLEELRESPTVHDPIQI